MKVKIKKVSYCDFCNKHSLKSLVKHEKHCTANPDRQCRLCQRDSIKDLISKYKIEIKKEWFTNHNSILGETGAEIEKMVAEKITALELDVDGCPNCTLAIIRCNKYKLPIYPNFDYKKALENWWANINRDKEV